jgi:long-chain acyl-CoA synthetase
LLNSAETPYDEKPWLGLYDSNKLSTIVPEFHDALAMFRAAVAAGADKPAILYFDATLSYGEVDRLSDALAAALVDNGFAPGDRFGVYLQNVPQFVIAILAAWKAGGIAVAINPMNRDREIGILFDDCQPQALICHGSLSEDDLQHHSGGFPDPQRTASVCRCKTALFRRDDRFQTDRRGI